MSDNPSIRFSSKADYLPQLSIDCVIFGYRDRNLHVLIPKLNLPSAFFTLPGGFILQDEGIDAAARRILEGRTGISEIYLEQFRTFGDPDRSGGTFMEEVVREHVKQTGQDFLEMEWLTRRFVSIGYYALVDLQKVTPVRGDIDVSVDWYPIKELPTMILDHGEIVAEALQALRQNLDQKLIGFNLLAEKFTMRELRELYEAVYDRPFTRSNFQKKMLDLNVLERLEKKFTGASNKAPFLYWFNR
ncbi:MAG: 8-oxo-dGTP diphosphatase [Neolewinella sp.]|jgi:ADP-ribose pyrophosphatase YjhB (NUDIX family)